MAKAVSIVSPVTYDRGTPSPYPTCPSSSVTRTTRLSLVVRSCEAWRIAFFKGTAT